MLTIILGLLSAFSPLAIDMYVPAFPRIEESLGTAAGSVQWTLSAYLVGVAVGQLFWGTLSDRSGRRPPLVVGCAVFAGSSAACALSNSLVALLVGRFLMGLGGSAGVVVGRAIVRDLFEQHQAAVFLSRMMMVGGLAPIIAPSLGGLVLRYADWRAIFWFLCVFGAGCALSVAARVPETRRAASAGTVRSSAGSFRRVIANRHFLGLAGACSMNSGMLFAYIAGSPFVFMRLFGLTAQQYGLAFGANAVGLYAAAHANRWLLRRYPSAAILRAASIATGILACALLLAAATGFATLPVTAPILFLCIAGFGLVAPNATAAAMQPFTEDAGTASALLGTLQFAVGAAAGAVLGWVHSGTALPMSAVIAACSVSACLLVVLSGPRPALAGSHRPSQPGA